MEKDGHSEDDDVAVIEEPAKGRKKMRMLSEDEESDHVANAVPFNDRLEDSDAEHPVPQDNLDLSISDNEELPDEQEAKLKIEQQNLTKKKKTKTYIQGYIDDKTEEVE